MKPLALARPTQHSCHRRNPPLGLGSPLLPEYRGRGAAFDGAATRRPPPDRLPAEATSGGRRRG
eukprot:1242877-Prymnesium_polylepis.1